MKRCAVAILVVGALTACGGGSSGKTVDVTWTGATRARSDANAKGVADCLAIDDDRQPVDCSQIQAEKEFTRAAAAARARIKATECAKPGVGRVEVTGKNFNGRRTTSTERC